MKDLGYIHYFLGVEVAKFSHGLILHQRKYAADLLKRAKMHTSKPLSTPMVPHNHPIDTSLFSDPTFYRSIVGGLQYLTFTRPDIAYSVNFVCQHMHQPSNFHFQLVKRILRYVQGTLDHGIRLLSHTITNLYAFSYSDWGGCPLTRRSTTRFCTFLGPNCVSWSAKKQPTVARSSTEAEYRAMASAAAELTWITYLLSDIGFQLPQPPTLFSDNMSALHLTVNPVLHARTKHIEIDYHFVREKVAQGKLITQFVSSKDQLADIFTKPLSSTAFYNLCTKLGIWTLPRPSLRGDVKGKCQAVEIAINESGIKERNQENQPKDQP